MPTASANAAPQSEVAVSASPAMPQPTPPAPPAPPALPKEPKVFFPVRKKRSFWRSKLFWTLAILAVMIVGGGFAYGSYRASQSAAGGYETAAVTRGSITQTVTATGAVKSASEFSLNFEASGRIATIEVAKGDTVKAGQVLATLEATDYSLAADKAEAALAEAQANLSKALAGATDEEVRVKEAALEEAQASLDQASTTLRNTKLVTDIDVKTAELAVQKAQADYDAAKQAVDDSRAAKEQAVADALSGEYSDVNASAVTMATALTDMDNILGVDNTLANDSFEYLLAAANPTLLAPAKSAYSAARDAKNALDDKLAGLPTDPSESQIGDAASDAKRALGLVAVALSRTRTVLDYTSGSGVLTLTDLNTKKTTIDTDRTAVNTKYDLVTTDVNATALAEIDRDTAAHTTAASFTSADIALQKAKHDLDVAKLQADTQVAADTASVSVYGARLDEAHADLDQTTAKLRDVDRAPLEAAVSQARAQAQSAEADLGKTRIVAPTDGIVTDVPVNVGELASAQTAAVSMISSHYEIEADVAETDIAKVKVGQTVDITFDALGRDTHFGGTVLSIDPAETVIQDIVYYKVRTVIGSDSDQIRPGMTANLTIQTAQKSDALIVPLRAVLEDSSGRYVQTLVAGKPVRVAVTIGLYGDQGMVEIVGDVKEGDQVVTGLKSQK